jgi:predicted transcriptional regulator
LNSPSPKDILFFLTDDTSLNILKLLDGKEYSIQQIASLLNLPISTTYRKVNKLEQIKILKKTKIVRKIDGTDESLYTSWIDEIQVSFKNNRITCNIKNRYQQDKIVRLWQSFKQ